MQMHKEEEEEFSRILKMQIPCFLFTKYGFRFSRFKRVAAYIHKL